MEEPLSVASSWVNIYRTPFPFNELVSPKQLCNTDEQIPLRKMDTRTESSTNSIPVVISACKICRDGIFRGQLCTPLESIWVEVDGRKFFLGTWIVVQSPDIDNNQSSFRDVVAIDYIIYKSLVYRPSNMVATLTRVSHMWDTQRCDRSPSHRLFHNLRNIR
jgi:hypothetical protein